MGTEDALKAADEALACIATIGESRTAYEFNGNLDIIANTTSLSTASIKATVDDLKTLLSEFGLRADVFRYEQSRPQLIVLCEKLKNLVQADPVQANPKWMDDIDRLPQRCRMGEYERHPEAARWLRNIIDGFQPYVQQTTDLRTKAEDFRNYLITFEAQGEKFYPLVDWRNDVVKCTEGIHPVFDWDDAHKYGREPQKSEQTINSGALLSIRRVLELLEGINQNLKRDKSGFVSELQKLEGLLQALVNNCNKLDEKLTHDPVASQIEPYCKTIKDSWNKVTAWISKDLNLHNNPVYGAWYGTPSAPRIRTLDVRPWYTFDPSNTTINVRFDRPRSNTPKLIWGWSGCHSGSDIHTVKDEHSPRNSGAMTRIVDLNNNGFKAELGVETTSPQAAMLDAEMSWLELPSHDGEIQTGKRNGGNDKFSPAYPSPPTVVEWIEWYWQRSETGSGGIITVKSVACSGVSRWLAYPQDKKGIYAGTVKADGMSKTVENGVTVRSYQVTFPEGKFAHQVPRVFVAFSAIEAAGLKPIFRISTEVRNVDKKGFTMIVKTWPSSEINEQKTECTYVALEWTPYPGLA